jgi:hypothetical protein
MVAALLAAGLVAACGGRQKFTPWLVPEEKFFGSVRTIAVSPVVIPGDLERPQPVQATFDSLIASQLRAAGFGIVPAAAVAQVLERASAEAGGLYNPTTGALDTVRAAAIDKAVRDELRERYSADALLGARLVTVTAEFSDGDVVWDGAIQSTESFGGAALRLMLGISKHGTVPAYSLSVQIKNVAGEQLYYNRGGIEVAGKWTGRNKLQLFPRDQLFDEPDRNAGAVRIALRPLLEHKAPAVTIR